MAKYHQLACVLILLLNLATSLSSLATSDYSSPSSPPSYTPQKGPPPPSSPSPKTPPPPPPSPPNAPNPKSPPTPTPSVRYPPPPKQQTCPMDALQLSACVDVLGGLVHVGLGGNPKEKCCPLVQGLADLDAAVCLCTAIRVKALNLINLLVPVSLQVLANDCGKYPPAGFQCPPLAPSSPSPKTLHPPPSPLVNSPPPPPPPVVTSPPPPPPVVMSSPQPPPVVIPPPPPPPVARKTLPGPPVVDPRTTRLVPPPGTVSLRNPFASAQSAPPAVDLSVPSTQANVAGRIR